MKPNETRCMTVAEVLADVRLSPRTLACLLHSTTEAESSRIILDSVLPSYSSLPDHPTLYDISPQVAVAVMLLLAPIRRFLLFPRPLGTCFNLWAEWVETLSSSPNEGEPRFVKACRTYGLSSKLVADALVSPGPAIKKEEADIRDLMLPLVVHKPLAHSVPLEVYEKQLETLRCEREDARASLRQTEIESMQREDEEARELRDARLETEGRMRAERKKAARSAIDKYFDDIQKTHEDQKRHEDEQRTRTEMAVKAEALAVLHKMGS